MKCSVLLPVLNGGRELRVAIESILGQDEPKFELIIIDDHSTHNSARLIREYLQRDHRIRGIFHHRNLGVADALNQGLAEARTELVVRMDRDDESQPHRLGTLALTCRTTQIQWSRAVTSTYGPHHAT